MTRSPFDAIRRTREDGAEYWSARDLMPLLGYDKWERFAGAIERAEITATNQGEQRFSRVRENLPGGTKPREDFHLTRFQPSGIDFIRKQLGLPTIDPLPAELPAGEAPR